jgi:hypothetical protein
MKLIPKTMEIDIHENKNIHSMFMLVYFIERRSMKYSSSVVIISMSVFSICCPSTSFKGVYFPLIFMFQCFERSLSLSTYTYCICY